MSQQLMFEKSNNLDRLHDQLVAAGVPVERIEGVDDTVWITVPDDVDESVIQRIVDAHKPTPTAPPADRMATALGKLADADATLVSTTSIAGVKTASRQMIEALRTYLEATRRGGAA